MTKPKDDIEYYKVLCYLMNFWLFAFCLFASFEKLFGMFMSGAFVVLFAWKVKGD